MPAKRSLFSLLYVSEQTAPFMGDGRARPSPIKTPPNSGGEWAELLGQFFNFVGNAHGTWLSACHAIQFKQFCLGAGKLA
jgi:hypothetical protein